MSRVWLDEPVDQTHADCLEAKRWVRQQVNAARRRLGLPPRDYRP